MESSLTLPELLAVQPVRPPAGYIGGKRNLSRRLVAMIEATPHDLYAEGFVGMGGVFFRRTRRPKAEVINDISTDVATLFRILQRHYQSFIGELKWRFASRAEFERLMAVDPSTCTDLERAARFLYLQRNAFGGKVMGRNFGVSYGAPSKFRLSALEPMLQDVHDRLEGVYIERLPYADFIRRYDRPGALFYLDPPYFGCEDDYGKDVFSATDFEHLSSLLEGLQGRFILSINDVPAVRAIFAGFTIEPVELTYSVGGNATRARELIISGPRGES
jgi:DNA adenine methylase